MYSVVVKNTLHHFDDNTRDDSGSQMNKNNNIHQLNRSRPAFVCGPHMNSEWAKI